MIRTFLTAYGGAAVAARRRAGLKLVQAERRAADRAEQERQRIARDLHDSVSQTLFSLGLHAGIARHEVARATNAVKHSGCREVGAVVSAAADGGVTLTVHDAGSGFDPAAQFTGHLGLALMRSRAEEAGGTVLIESCLLYTSD